MNNGTSDTPSIDRTATSARNTRPSGSADDLETLKRDLMKAEVRRAKARATVATAEIDIRVLGARLKAVTKQVRHRRGKPQGRLPGRNKR